MSNPGVNFSVNNSETFNSVATQQLILPPERILDYDTFQTFTPILATSNSKNETAYKYFALSPPYAPSGNANDATVTASVNGLLINATPQPFTFNAGGNILGTVFGGIDHVKYLVYKNKTYTLPDNGDEFKYEMQLATQLNPMPDPLNAEFATLTTDPGGIKNLADDPRLGSMAMNMLDPVTLSVFDIFVTREGVWGLYEQLPFNKPGWFAAYSAPHIPTPSAPSPVAPLPTDYQAYTHMFPLLKREQFSPMTNFVTVAIAINKKYNYVRFLVNGIEKFRISNYGLPLDRTYRVLDHGGPPKQTTLNTIQCGFGLFTLLDMHLPRDYDPNNNPVVNDASLVQIGTSNQYIHPRTTDYAGDWVVDNPILSGGGATTTLYSQGVQGVIRYSKMSIVPTSAVVNGKI